jgi:hypothetical protein
VRSDALGHHDVGAGIAQRRCLSGGIIAEERLQGARDEVHARKRTRHNSSLSVIGSPAICDTVVGLLSEVLEPGWFTALVQWAGRPGS